MLIMGAVNDRPPRRASVWWETWGGLVLMILSSLGSGLISGAIIWHNIDNRLTVIEKLHEFRLRQLEDSLRGRTLPTLQPVRDEP